MRMKKARLHKFTNMRAVWQSTNLELWHFVIIDAARKREQRAEGREEKQMKNGRNCANKQRETEQMLQK